MDGGTSARLLVTEEQLARLRVALIRNAPVFDDPTAYQSGVEDALEAVLDLADGEPARTGRVSTASSRR
jgi:hypothetical protein